MAAHKLNSRFIKSLEFPKDAPRTKQIIHWDSVVRGLGVRVYPDTKRFVFRYRDALSRQRIVTLGEFGSDAPLLNVARARQAATLKRAEVLEGRDPLSRTKSAKVTVADLADRFVGYARDRGYRTWKTDQDRVNRHINPRFGRVRVVALPREAVVQFHTDIGTKDCGREKGCMKGGKGKCDGHRVEANRLVQLMSRIINWGRDQGIIQEDAVNPAARFRKHMFKAAEKKKQDRAARFDEVERLATAVLRVRNPQVRAAIWLLALLGLRKGELLGLEWSQLNLTHEPMSLPDRTTLPSHSLFLPGTKNKSKRDFITPLPKAALSLLKTQQNDTDWVFPSDTKSGHLESVDYQWRRARTRAKVPGFTLHDWRATVATWARTHREEPESVIARLLNHRSPEGITQRYLDELPFERIRASLNAHADMLLRAAKVQSSLALIHGSRISNVLPLRATS